MNAWSSKLSGTTQATLQKLFFGGFMWQGGAGVAFSLGIPYNHILFYVFTGVIFHFMICRIVNWIWFLNLSWGMHLEFFLVLCSGIPFASGLLIETLWIVMNISLRICELQLFLVRLVFVLDFFGSGLSILLSAWIWHFGLLFFSLAFWTVLHFLLHSL